VGFYRQRAGAENLIKEANNDAGLAAHPSARRGKLGSSVHNPGGKKAPTEEAVSLGRLAEFALEAKQRLK
jgi:hypothetical protein